MPTIFSHAFFGIAVGSGFLPGRLRFRFLVLTALCTILPDFDVIGFAFRINYGSVLGHRGITHSIAFALLLGWLVAVLCFKGLDVPRWKLFTYFSAVTFSHTLLDMLTNGGLGVALFAPLSNERFFFPWRPVQVSPIGAGFFSERGVSVMISELVWIWIPAVVIAAVLWVVLRKSVRDHGGSEHSNHRQPDVVDDFRRRCMRSAVLFVMVLLLVPVAALAQTKSAAPSKYVGYKYKGVPPENLLPNGVKHLGGGLVGDFDADPVYGISRVTKGTTTMLWLEVSTGRDATGITGWRVLDVLSFPPLRSTQHLAFALDPAISCTRSGKELTDDTVMIGQLFRKLGLYQPQRVWIANLKTGKFESAAATGLKCTYSEP